MSVMSIKRILSKKEKLERLALSDDENSSGTIKQKKRLLELINRILTASHLEEILIELKDDIAAFFEAEKLTIYVIDGVKRELVSRVLSGNDKLEIRIPVSMKSLAGYSAYKQEIVNIKDAYNDEELQKISNQLKFDKKWDQSTGFRTRAVLAVPITFQKYFLGVIQLLNSKNESGFTSEDELAAAEMARTLGIAFYNQKVSALKKKTSFAKFDYLIEKNFITPKDLEKAIADARRRNEDILDILLDDFRIPKDVLGSALSKFYNVPFIEYNSNIPIPGELLQDIKIPFLKKHVWVPIRMEDDRMIIAIDDPDDLQRRDEVRSIYGDKFKDKKMEFHLALKRDVNQFINLFSSNQTELESIDKILDQLRTEEKEIEEMEDAVTEEDSAAVQLVNKIILDAHARGASDIHIEPFPGKDKTVVRLRIDGECMIYQTIPYHFRNAIVSRLKIMSDLDIADRRKPQDGKIKFIKYGGKDIELRVATIPTQGGLEDVVMRILASGEPIPLEKVGFSKRTFDFFHNSITKPYGIILVVGPTGSGKTTTLHSALGYINKPERKIWTAEDPVEITQKGLRQVQVAPKFGVTFASTMRAFLRADPDVIMVGEMRDKETTQIGIEASLTGHLVFSTLHTNSAPETISRLLDMGMDPFNFADALLCILAQRLARTLCSKCKEQYHPTQEEYDELVREYDPELFVRNVNIPYSKDLTLYRPKGCSSCNNTGYRGRMGLFELLTGTDKIKKLIQNKNPMDIIRTQAIQDGMATLKQDGIEKVFSGYLDLFQVRKVCIV